MPFSQEALKEVTNGALLHDVGKILWRISGSTSTNHQKLGGEFLRWKKPNINLSKYAKYAENHHEKEAKELADPFVWIVHIADKLSAQEREDIENYRWKREALLFNILSKVQLGEGKPPKSFFEVREKSAEIIYPVKKLGKGTFSKYENIAKSLGKALERAAREGDIHPNVLLRILERFTFFIPSETRATEDLETSSDISLFSHLKTTAMIAGAIYGYLSENGWNERLDILKMEKTVKKEKAFLLVGGDISGIQKFIYNISSKGALKSLRARSIFIELFINEIVRQILEKTGFFNASIHFVGGGRFYLILPNIERVKKAIKGISKEANEWLTRKSLKIRAIIESVTFEGEKFEDLDAVFQELRSRMEERKLSPYSQEELRSLFEIKLDSNVSECSICGTRITGKAYDIGDGRPVCEFCHSMWNFGGAVVKNGNYLLEAQGKEWDLEILGRKYKIYEEVPDKSSTNILFRGYKLISDDKDIFEDPEIIILPAGAMAEETEFSELAERAEGKKLIGIFRADVDNLSRIFREGLENRSLSRISTLSTMISLFFKEYVRKIAKDHKNVIVVYAGGDDLFAVGSWNDLFEFALAVREAFGRFSGENPCMTLSGGFVIMDEKEEIYRMAQIAGEAEDIAKNFEKDGKRKDAMHIWEGSEESKVWNTARWNDIKEIWSAMKAALVEDGKLKITKSALRKLMSIQHIAQKKPPLHKPYIHYYKMRLKMENVINRIESFFGERGTMIVLKMIDLMTRKEGAV